MTTKDGMAGGGGAVALGGKMLCEGDPTLAAFHFLVMPGAIKVMVPAAIERSGEWKNKMMGQKCTIRVPSDFANRHNLVFGQSSGMGGKMGTGGSSLGGVING